MKVALFSHHFLEPTHHAIAAVLSSLKECEFWVFGKRFTDQRYFKIDNVVGRTFYVKGPLNGFSDAGFGLAHIIYDGDIAFEAVALCRAAHVPFLLSFHGGFDTKAKIHDPAYRRRTQLIARAAAAITVVSASDALRLEELEVNRPVSVVPVPVDPAGLPRPTQCDQNTLASVGRLVPKKGVDVSLEALLLLPEDYTLSVIGDGILGSTLKEYSASLGLEKRVQWLGMLPLPETLEVLATCGALLHSARVAEDGNAEGTPQIILLAQAMGVPVITTHTGDIPDIVTDGETGFLIESDSPQALAEAVMRLRSDDNLRGKITAHARRRVMETHAMNKVVAQWRTIYYRTARKTNVR